MNELLRKIANTVIANLDNTTEIGLFKGRMGLTIFLYEYARYSGNSVYEKMADTLIDRIYTQFKPGISFSMIDGSASIGIGLSYLLRNHFIEGNIDKENVLQLQKDLLRLSVNALEKRYYQFSDILLLKYILPLVPKEISIDDQSRLRSLLSGINMDDFNIEEWNNGLWWCFVYDITSLEYSIEAIEKYVDQKMLDYSFDLDDINSQFSVLGLNLIIK